MSKAAQLKKKAAEFEQKKQYDRALTTYVQAIDAAAGLPDEIDIPLYNRVGDLHFRLGEVDRALSYYEKAVDLYTEGGFFNNAIALCNKVLRHAPSRSSIYYKLGRISAKKGFNSDAKQNFLEYAGRMQKAGQMDEAFRALKEFADLCPGQDDVRLMLAEQLSRVGRKDEALEQLQIVHDTMVAEDRGREASATLDRMRAIDPTFQPKQGSVRRAEKRDGLVFIDVSDTPAPSASVTRLAGLESTAAFEAPDVAHPRLEIEPTHHESVALHPEPTPESPSVSLDHAVVSSASEPTPMAAEPDVESEIEPDVEPDVPEEPQADYDQPAAESSMATDWVEPQAADEPSSDTLFAIPPEPEPTAEFASDSSLEFAPAYESAIIPEPEADEPLDLADAEPYVEEIEAETLDPESIGEDADPSVEAEAYPETSPTQPDTDSDQSAPSAAQVEFHSAEPGQAISGDFSSDSAPEAASAPDAAQDGSWASLAASPGPVDSSSRRTGEFDYGVASDEHSPLDGLAARIQEPSDVVAPPPEPVAMERDEDFVDLSEWLRGGDTTSRTADSEFSDMLETFKRGVAESMDDGDSESHYDLGVAYKEMGLLAEAIAQFEKAIRGSAPADRRVRAYESLGECHIETQNYETAVSALYGALTESSLTDDKLVGVLYLLGYAAECLDRWTDARAYYKRVYAVDPSFRDIDQRFRHASRAAEAAEV